MEVAGFPAITDEGVQMLAPGGRYVEIGNISPGLTYAADPSYWVTQNISIFGVNHYSRKHLRDALDILRRTRQRYPYERIVSHRFRIGQINKAMAPPATGTGTSGSLVPGACGCCSATAWSRRAMSLPPSRTKSRRTRKP